MEYVVELGPNTMMWMEKMLLYLMLALYVHAIIICTTRK